ncbi:MAG: hypothetical protein M1839_003065 [Geoglossum umbratile]|nr:MAG: hypothetical protein M1839_003065 [Geoglossum umbratile]
MASPEANSKATALPQLGLSAVYRLPNVSQNVQCLSPEEAYGQAAARAASPPPRPHAPSSSPVLSTESGNDLQNVDDPGFPFGPPFDGLSMPQDEQFGPEDNPGMSNPSDSLRIGPKGESSFPCLSDFSRSATPMAGSSPLGLHSYSEGEYPTSGDFRNSIPEMPPAPQGSPSLPASLQTLTLEGITENEEEFKMVDEIWDQSANKYNIVESSGSSYPFVVSRRFGKPNTEPKRSINIKSEGLRAIVLQALEDDSNASARSPFGEEGITVDLEALLSCLSQLEDRLAIYAGFTLAPAKRTDAPGEHLKKLVKFLKPFREINIMPTTHSEEADIYQ